MKPPASAKVVESHTSRYWFEEDVLCIVSLKIPQLDLAMRIKQLEEIKKITGGKKIYAIVDITDSEPFSRETREYHSQEFPSIFKAMAVIASTPAAKMIANLYLGLQPLPFPVKVFDDETEARSWIKQQKARNL